MGGRSVKKLKREVRRQVKANYREFWGVLCALPLKERVKTAWWIVRKKPLPGKRA